MYLHRDGKGGKAVVVQVSMQPASQKAGAIHAVRHYMVRLHTKITNSDITKNCNPVPSRFPTSVCLNLKTITLTERQNSLRRPPPTYTLGSCHATLEHKSFNISRWPNRMMFCRHPILGRNEELRKYKAIIQNAIDSSQQRFTRYRDHQFAVAIIVSSPIIFLQVVYG